MFSSKEEIKEKGVGVAIMSLLFLISLFILRGALVSILWNQVMPVLFNLPKIGVGYSLMLIILTDLLFAGFGSKK